MTPPVRKAVFPVAGLGTRTLPATKVIAKEMLPVVDKPVIQYAVEEAIGAGITELIFIVSRNKDSIREHFSPAPELEAELRKKGKSDQLSSIRNIIPAGVSCRFVIQEAALGLGHAVLCARDAVGDEPFAVLLPDDMIDNGEHSCLRQLLAVYGQHGASVIGVENIPRDLTDRYGIIEPRPFAERIHRIAAIVEKPAPAVAPSTLAVVGRYVLVPEVWRHLETTRAGAGGEIQLTDGISGLLATQPVLALEFEGTRFDCGTKLGLLQANVQMALRDPALSGSFRQYLQSLHLDAG